MLSKVEQPRFGCEDLARLYSTALTADIHDDVLDLVAERLPGAAVLFVSQDTVEPNGNYLLHRGLDIDASRSFSVDISANSVWFKKQWQQPVGGVFQQRDLIEPEDFRDTRFYRNWLADRGDFEQCTGVVFHRKGTRQTVLEVRYGRKDEAVIAPMARRLLSELAPHMTNSARTADMRKALQEAQWEHDQIVSLIPFPTMIVDADCRVEGMNPQAECLFHTCESIILGPDKRLHGIEPEADSELKLEVRRMSTDPTGEKRWLRFNETDRQRGIFLTLIRLNPPYSTLQPAAKLLNSAGERRVAIIAHHAFEHFRLSHDMLWQTFGLTSRESELAGELLDGYSIGDIAVRKHLSKQTLRNQLVSVMRKTGTRRQVDLVASLQMLAMSSPG